MSDSTEKLSDFLPLSPDHNAERLAALKSLFPDIFTNEGKLNIEEFKKVVDPALVSETERYDFRWYGKTASKREAFTPSRAALVYDKDRSVNPEKARGNMIIEGGKRQFIVVQMPEQTVSNSPATRAGFKKISDITIERAKRVIGRIQKEAEDLLPYDAQRQFADSLGFKVFKLAKSNFPRVEFVPDPDKSEAENIESLKHYINEKEKTFHLQWERETVMDEVLLKNGFMLDYSLTRRPEFKKNEVFLAKDAHKESLICLDSRIAPETVDHFKKNTWLFFICLELALDTTRKWNLKHHLGDKLKAI